MLMRALCAGIFAVCSVGIARAQSTPDPNLRRPLPEPFWSSNKIAGEPLFFIKEPSQPAAASRLLFQPSGNLRLTNAAATQVYLAGTDYTWDRGTNIVTLTANSRIPFKTREEMTPPAGAHMSFGKTATGQGVFFSEGHVFNDLQVRATYEHDDRWNVPPAASSLPRTLARLGTGAPLKIVVLGDSISAGSNATAYVKAPPFQPMYSELVAADLRMRFSSPVTLTNLSVGGKKSEWGITMVPQVVEAKPDLLILAFGMNDREPNPEFAENIRKTINQVLSACPECDVILVASMMDNPLLLPPEHFTGYRDALHSLVKNNIVLADVTAVWMQLLQKKSFSDLTGNGVNHPNDFGHLVYAEVISQLLRKN